MRDLGPLHQGGWSGGRKGAESTLEEMPPSQSAVAVALLLALERAEAAPSPRGRTSAALTVPFWKREVSPSR